MDPVKIHLNGDGCWPDLETTPFTDGVLMEVAYLPGGMSSSNPSVSLRCTMADGSVALIQTSARMFVTVAAAIKGKCQHDGIDV